MQLLPQSLKVFEAGGITWTEESKEELRKRGVILFNIHWTNHFLDRAKSLPFTPPPNPEKEGEEEEE